MDGPGRTACWSGDHEQTRREQNDVVTDEDGKKERQREYSGNCRHTHDDDDDDRSNDGVARDQNIFRYRRGRASSVGRGRKRRGEEESKDPGYLVHDKSDRSPLLICGVMSPS